MSDEIELLTTNAAGDSWVDASPSAVSTGYQAQNVNIEANRNGVDKSTPAYNATTDKIIIPVSGIIDEAGLPFVVKSEITLEASGMVIDTKYYLRLVAGSDTTLRSLELTTEAGEYEASKNGYYLDGDRVLSWVLIKTAASTLVYAERLHPTETIIDKNGNEVTAMKIETKSVTGTFNTGSPAVAYVTVAIPFSNTIQGLVFQSAAWSYGDTEYDDFSGYTIKSFSISGSTLNLTILLNYGSINAQLYYKITATCAID